MADHDSPMINVTILFLTTSIDNTAQVETNFQNDIKVTEGHHFNSMPAARSVRPAAVQKFTFSLINSLKCLKHK